MGEGYELVMIQTRLHRQNFDGNQVFALTQSSDHHEKKAHLENKLLLTSINSTPKNSHNCHKKL